jgi:hypothetical protein
VGDGIEPLEEHGLEVVALAQPGLLEQHDGDGGRQGELHADLRAGEVGERAHRLGMRHEDLDRGVAVDRQRHEVGLVVGGVGGELAERARRRHLGLVARDERIVLRRPAGRDRHVEAELVVVAALVGQDHLDDRGGGGEVEARQVADRAGFAVGLAARLGERLTRHDGELVGPATFVVAGGGRGALVTGALVTRGLVARDPVAGGGVAGRVVARGVVGAAGVVVVAARGQAEREGGRQDGGEGAADHGRLRAVGGWWYVWTVARSVGSTYPVTDPTNNK